MIPTAWKPNPGVQYKHIQLTATNNLQVQLIISEVFDFQEWILWSWQSMGVCENFGTPKLTFMMIPL